MDDGLESSISWSTIRRRRSLSPPNWRADSSPTNRRQRSSIEPPKRFARATAISRRSCAPSSTRRSSSRREVYQAKIKNPFEFVTSALRVTGSEAQVTHQLLRYLGRMGEPLFLAQAPTGYPDIGGLMDQRRHAAHAHEFRQRSGNNRLPGTECGRWKPEGSRQSGSPHRAGLAVAGDASGPGGSRRQASRSRCCWRRRNFKGDKRWNASRRSFSARRGLGFLALGLAASVSRRAPRKRNRRKINRWSWCFSAAPWMA